MLKGTIMNLTPSICQQRSISEIQDTPIPEEEVDLMGSNDDNNDSDTNLEQTLATKVRLNKSPLWNY